MTLAVTTFHIAILFMAAVIFIAVAISDLASRRVPYYMTALLLALFPLVVITAPRSIDWKQNGMIFVLVAITGFILFLGKLVNADDVRLLAVSSLWAGPHLIAVMLFVTACAGCVESLIVALVTHRRQRRTEIIDEAELQKVTIPYGVAIAAGGLAMLGMMAQPILLPFG